MESSHGDSEHRVRRLLKKRLGEIVRGRTVIGPREEKVTFTDLAELPRDDYANNQRHSTRRLADSLKHSRVAFGHLLAVDIDGARIEAYKAARREAGTANGTINRKLSALKAAFNLAVRAE